MNTYMGVCMCVSARVCARVCSVILNQAASSLNIEWLLTDFLSDTYIRLLSI